jgi:hypothetical protein
MIQKIYIEAKAQKSQKPIVQVIKKLGLVFPNSSLGFIHARYASFSEANGNSVLLAETVKKDVPKLLFTQANYQHKREYGPVLGSILDAWVNEDTNEIEIVFSFYKTLYPKLWEQAQKDLDNNNLTVSFELMVSKSNIETLPNGVKKLHRVDFDGVGVLFSGTKPAFKEAFCLESAMLEIEQMLNADSPELIYANAKNIAEKWTKIGQMLEKAINDKQDINKEEILVDKTSKDALLAIFKTELTKELGEEVVKDWTDEQFAIELEKRAKVDENDKSKENKASEQKSEEKLVEKEEIKSEEKPVEKAEDKKEEAQIVNEKTTETRIYDVKRDTENSSMEVIETTTTQKEVDGKVVMDEKITRQTVYAQEKIDAMKVDYETKIAEKEAIISAKDADIKAKDEAIIVKDAQIKLIKENAKLIITKRNELGEFARDLSDEDLIVNNDKVKIATLTKENAELKAKKTEPIVTANDKTEKEEKVLLEASVNGKDKEVTPEMSRKVMKIRTGQKV